MISGPTAFILADTRLQPVPHAPEISLWLADEVTPSSAPASGPWRERWTATLGGPSHLAHLEGMTAARALAAVVLLAAPSAAQAQSRPPLPPGASAHELNRYQADRHRYEMNQLRARADQREALARRLQLETRLNRLDIEAARRPEPVQPPAWRPPRTPEEERAAREAAARRREATAAGVGQIDAWLDRGR